MWIITNFGFFSVVEKLEQHVEKIDAVLGKK